MGGCSGHSVRPPQNELIGTWILNEESRDFQVHSSPLRQSYKLNSQMNRSLLYKKLTIRSNGFIKYQECDHGSLFQIEGPVVKWTNNSAETFNGSVLKIDFIKAKQGFIIVQDDKLYRD